MNISPVIGEIFAVTKSMQNTQVLTKKNGCNKYLCKYIVKIDEKHSVVIFTDVHKNGTPVSKSNFIHFTNISSSNKNEEYTLINERYCNHPRGIVISMIQMLHIVLKYREVHTNLLFENITTIPLELHAENW